MSFEQPLVRILISGCLFGWHCTFRSETSRLWADGTFQKVADMAIAEGVFLLPVCPEQLGGLGTPRPPAELQNDAEEVMKGHGRVVDAMGADVTEAFRKGAREALHAALRGRVGLAVLKDGSPSCGSSRVHAGIFDGKTRPGEGLTTFVLRDAGIRVIDEITFKAALEASQTLSKLLSGYNVDS